MEVADLDAVVANEFTAYAFPWTRGIFLDCMKARHECWVVSAAAEIVAHAVLSVAAGEGHLLNVCVRRDQQGLGYGRMLVEHMLRRARARSAGMVFLEVRPSNFIAAELYETMGFREIGIRKNYYPAALGHEDARVLALDLDTYFRDESV